MESPSGSDAIGRGATAGIGAAEAATDAGDSLLRCPRCDYNLTGLTGSRCPECGAIFDWDRVRSAAQRPAALAFERARGWRKATGFLVTWSTSLFAPWTFARQIVERVHAGHAAIFGAVCFLMTSGSFLFGAGLPFWLTWTCTAGIYLVCQAALLSLAEAGADTHVLRRFGFWLMAGFYTSAVMPTEMRYGPPILGITNPSELLEFIAIPFTAGKEAVLSQPQSVNDLCQSLGSWAQMMLWLASLAFIFSARVRRRICSRVLRIALALTIAAALFLLYATIVEFVAADWLYGLFGGSSSTSGIPS